MSDARRMRDVPMLDSDREQMREEFESFDAMTMDEFRAAVNERVDSLLDLANLLMGRVDSLLDLADIEEPLEGDE